PGQPAHHRGHGQAPADADGPCHRHRAQARQHVLRFGAAGAGRGRALGQGAAWPAAAAGSLRRRLHLGFGADPLLSAMAETRVERVRAGDRDAWRKSYREGGRRGRLAALRWLARRMGTDALLPPGQQTPEQACLTAQAMIPRLAALGPRVPVILQPGPRPLPLSDLGPSLASRRRAAADPGRRERMLRPGLEATLRVQAQGGWLSQAFARSPTLDEAGIGCIDLAEDTRTVMSLASAQARDLLFY